MLKKSVYDNKDPYLALLEYRNTPLSSKLGSPSELLFNRKIRGLLPYRIPDDIQNNYQNIQNKLIERQNIQKTFYDRGTQNSKSLNISDNVFVRKSDNSKEKGQIISKCERPKSFNVQLESGHVVERNKKHLDKFIPREKFYIKDQIYDFTDDKIDNKNSCNDNRSDSN